MNRVRIDKWLWAARFFKTRALAAKSCDLGRVQANATTAKPSREVRVGDWLRIETPGGTFEVEVLLLSEMRGPAAIAQTLFQESEASRALRAKVAEEKKTLPQFDFGGEGRPSKRDRRDLNRIRGRF